MISKLQTPPSKCSHLRKRWPRSKRNRLIILIKRLQKSTTTLKSSWRRSWLRGMQKGPRSKWKRKRRKTGKRRPRNKSSNGIRSKLPTRIKSKKLILPWSDNPAWTTPNFLIPSSPDCRQSWPTKPLVQIATYRSKSLRLPRRSLSHQWNKSKSKKKRYKLKAPLNLSWSATINIWKRILLQWLPIGTFIERGMIWRRKIKSSFAPNTTISRKPSSKEVGTKTPLMKAQFSIWNSRWEAEMFSNTKRAPPQIWKEMAASSLSRIIKWSITFTNTLLLHLKSA